MTDSTTPVYNGRYELQSQVARGGTAQVYLARDIVLDRSVALKVLFSELSTDSSFVERFRREAQAAANLSHPNIVPVFDWGESDNTYYIVMEYIDGETLSSIIRTQAPLGATEAAAIASDIAKALAYAHRRGVVHRDVKPGNVLITADGQVKVTDFGIARAIGSDEQVTQTGLVMGTAAYFSPEQAQGHGVDGRSDVYALGVVLYEMVTGRPPFSGDTPVAIAYQHVREEPTAPREIIPSIPAALEAVILKAMAKSPGDRYATATDFEDDLNRFRRGQQVVGPFKNEDQPTQAVNTARDQERGPDTTVFQALPVSVDADAAEPHSSTRFWLLLGGALLVVLGLIVFFGGRALGYFGGAKYLTMPRVVGMKQVPAQNKLTGKGLRVKIEHVKASATISGKTNSGLVVHQKPSASSQVRQGVLVYLQVAGKAPPGVVPVVTNLDQAGAEAKLRAKGYGVSVHFVEAVTGEHQNIVLNQVPSGGSSYTLGKIVTIDVVKGTALVAIPRVAGDSQSTAGAKLAQAQLNISSTQQTRFSDSIPAGSVIGTTQASGTKLEQGSTVTLVISKGAAISVPNLQGMSIAEAESDLESVGLSYRIGPGQITNVAAFVGNVANQSPKTGKPVAKDFIVTIFPGEAPPTATTIVPSTTTATVAPPP